MRPCLKREGKKKGKERGKKDIGKKNLKYRHIILFFSYFSFKAKSHVAQKRGGAVGKGDREERGPDTGL